MGLAAAAEPQPAPPPRAQLTNDGSASPTRDFAAKPTKDIEVAQGPAPALGEEDAVDGVFGERAGEGAVDYRSLGWIGATVLLAKTQIGLGVLSIPSVFETLGIIPGVIILIVLAILTTWSGEILGRFKLRHPEVYSLSDCGRLMFGRVGDEVFGVAYFLLTTLVGGLGLLSISTALNAISLHATCTAYFMLVAVAVTYPFAAIRKLDKIAWITQVGLASIIISVLVVVIAVGAGGRPAAAPQTGPFDVKITLFGNPDFASAMNAVSNVLASYGGVPAAMPIISEMRDPRLFRRAIIVSQVSVTVFYLVIGIVLYVYAGPYVASPALGTAGTLIKRIAYGLALPGLIVSAMLFVHLPAKWVFVRALRDTEHLARETRTHYVVWFSCVAGCLAFSYVVASAVPFFGGLLGLASALFGTLLVIGAEPCMWIYDLRHCIKDRSARPRFFTLGVIINFAILLIAALCLVGGTYGSIKSIVDSYAETGGRPWSCADNSGSS
ncbi:hypothetical protein JCM9279_004919 [Rhodotorula babjevae]